MQRRELNVANLPNVVFGHRTILWLATLGLILIEGTVFAIFVASYFYLRTRASEWPPGFMPPQLLCGILITAVFIISALPNQFTKKAAESGDLRKVQIGLAIMTAVGIVALGLRVFEFRALNASWDGNAYGSLVWTLLGLHTVHLLTDWYDTVVLTALMFTNRVEGKRFMDTSENADYWWFVVFTWLPIWGVLYFAPRLL
jgi:cytochrome c oxidase subunit I+III